jgi:nitrate reductase gamma subunit
MVRFSKAAIISGVAALMVALLGTVLFMSEPSQSKDTRQNSNANDGVSTTLGF